MIMNIEILKAFSNTSNDDQTIVKGKRSKRPRPSASSTSSISATAVAGGDFSHNSIVSSSCSATISGEISTASTEEDEDMANCLILLARGGDHSPQTLPPEKVVPQEKKKKSSSRKFTEMATTTAEGKIGIYVCECKTCSRTFPSFQALGGHRASHKKTKTTADDDRKISPEAAIISPPPSTQSPPDKGCPKVHECSICGAEFGSGQALGGHMRRHRSVINSSNITTDDVCGESTRNVLALDLNMPAPEEDRRREDANFRQFSVVSTAALVDCHY